MLFADNTTGNQIDLVDWGDDRFVQEKEVNAENANFKFFSATPFPGKLASKMEPSFFYNGTFEEIKLKISTPPPRIG